MAHDPAPARAPAPPPAPRSASEPAPEPASAPAREPLRSTSRPLRVVFAAGAVSPDEQRWLLDAAAAMQAHGHQVEVATPGDTPLTAAAVERSLPTRRWRHGFPLDPRIGRDARVLFGAADAVIACDREAFGLARKAKAAIVMARTDQPAVWPDAASVAHAAAILVPPATAAGHRATRGAAHRSARSVAHRVIFDVAAQVIRTHIDPTTARRALRLPRRVRLVLYVAPLVPESDHEGLLQAIARRAATRPADAAPSRIALLGTGPEEARLRVLSYDLGIKDEVLWLGSRTDLAAYVAAVDAVLVTPSTTPRHLAMDAAALGLPVATARASWDAALAQLDAAAAPLVTAATLATAATLSTAAQAQQPSSNDAAMVAMDLECAVYAAALRQRPALPKVALFLDRDGTLVTNVPYNADPNRVALEPHVGRALRWARDAGFLLIVTTNQSGIGRGLLQPSDVAAIHERIRAELQPDGADLDALYFCPHLPDDACDCRKPSPGLLLRAAHEHGLDVARSVVIGDSPHDIEAARAAGARARGYHGVAAKMTEWPDGTIVHRDWLSLIRDVLAEAWREREGTGQR